MIRRTFQLVPGVGPWREKDLWARGIAHWDDFPAEGGKAAISSKVDERVRARLGQAQAALEKGDLATLAKMLPPREHWRLYRAFEKDAVFFDIEADGPPSQSPTVVSLFHEGGIEVFIEGRNLHQLPEALAAHRLWVTFNGSCFDVPVLKRHFGALPTPGAHIDLRFVCRRLRMPGGLKGIEDALGLSRPPHLRGVDGWDAIILWRAYRSRGDLEALRFLVEYNLYDSVNLKALMDIAYLRAADDLACEVARQPAFERGDVLYDVSRQVMALGPTARDLGVLERVRSQDRDLSRD
jgi:uncharacterized protein YprB with RNaseH-like and TPR domain